MPLIDPQGRLFGRANVIDVLVALAVFLLVPLGYVAYLLFKTPEPEITSVEPAVLVRGPELRLRITGTNLRPYMGASAGPNPALGFLVESPTAAEVRLPDLQPGAYDLTLFDHAREVARKREAFRVVGPAAPTPAPAASGATLQVVGEFGGLEEQAAHSISRGTKFPPSAVVPVAEVLAVRPPERALVRVRVGSEVVSAVVPGRFDVPAVLRIVCSPQADACAVGGVPLTPGQRIFIPGLTAPLEFMVREIRPANASPAFPAPPVRIMADVHVRFVVFPDVVPLLRPGSSDLDPRRSLPDRQGPPATLVSFRKQKEFSSRTSIDVSGPDSRGVGGTFFEVPHDLAPVDAHLRVPLERAPNGWKYKGETVKTGGPFSFEGHMYVMRGFVLRMTVGRNAAPQDTTALSR